MFHYTTQSQRSGGETEAIEAVRVIMKRREETEIACQNVLLHKSLDLKAMLKGMAIHGIHSKLILSLRVVSFD